MDLVKGQPLTGLQLRRGHWESMLREAERLAPQEACGLGAGRDGRLEAVLPVKNELQSQIRYRMDPVEQLKAFQWIDEHDLELLAIYHSHPAGPGEPSETDRSEAYYPDSVYLILSRQGSTWGCRGFTFQDGRFVEIPVWIDS
jgi:proteasome lid subunit RPN8/RPN11